MFENLQIGPKMHKTTGKTGENRGALPALTVKTGDNRGEPRKVQENLESRTNKWQHLLNKQRWNIENRENH